MRTESNATATLTAFITQCPCGAALDKKESSKLPVFKQNDGPSPHIHVSGPTEDQLSWLLSSNGSRIRSEMVKRREIAKFLHLDLTMQRIVSEIHPDCPSVQENPSAFGIDISQERQDLDKIVAETREMVLNKALSLDSSCFNRLIQELERKNFLQLKNDLLFLKKTRSPIWEASTMRLALNLDSLRTSHKELFLPKGILGLSDRCTTSLTSVFLQFEKAKQNLVNFLDLINKTPFVPSGDALFPVLKGNKDMISYVKSLEVAEKNAVGELKTLETCLHKAKEIYFKERLAKFKALLKHTHKTYAKNLPDAYEEALRWYVNTKQLIRQVPIDCSLLSEMTSLEEAILGGQKKTSLFPNIWVSNVSTFESLLKSTRHSALGSSLVEESDAWIVKARGFLKEHPDQPLPVEFRNEMQCLRQKLQDLA